jgi:hypothetical protein
VLGVVSVWLLRQHLLMQALTCVFWQERKQRFPQLLKHFVRGAMLQLR